ncbi:SLC13 family permease [Desulfofalx alkaliphila]|uniref:SLC13 family permease n=1 Tax=Desulfofalx alkaliphila TaxID=105483 RepID=UPI00068D06EE|nr:SLC13 family permease [Desulfofalx alkaliphila]
MTKQVSKKGFSELAKVAIYLVIVAIGWFMPPMGAITDIGMKLIFVFIAAVYAWSVSSETWPSLLTFVLIPATGVIPFKDFITAGWGTETALFIVLMFILVKFLEEQGVSQFIAAWMLKRKFLQGHPWRMFFMILLVAYLICSLINIFVGIFLVWGVVYSISKSLGFKPYDKFPTVVIFGVAVMGALSLTAMPWGTNSIVLLAFFGNLVGAPIDLAKYITFTVPYGLVVIAAYLLLSKFVYRLDVSGLKNMDDSFINDADLELTPTKK